VTAEVAKDRDFELYQKAVAELAQFTLDTPRGDETSKIEDELTLDWDNMLTDNNNPIPIKLPTCSRNDLRSSPLNDWDEANSTSEDGWESKVQVKANVSLRKRTFNVQCHFFWSSYGKIATA